MSRIISIENLGKMYRINRAIQQQVRYRTMREALMELPKRFFKRKSQKKEEFWALRDASLSVHQGECLGIIGHNGAGKSTLLKLLSRITEPTTGRIVLNGRVASLLEVGTGFHPELTGRENIYLNGSILGMTHAEVRKKFDEIVDFSGIEKFLETPVKRYSSGMYVRLAFSVAAHLEPEILVIDEVLAVGDAEFQKKCLGKMEDVAKGKGRTVLFVSHQLPAVQRLCERVIFLQNGQVAFDGDTSEGINKYLHMSSALRETKAVNNISLLGENDQAYFTQISISTDGGPIVSSGDQAVFLINGVCSKDTCIRFSIHIRTETQSLMFILANRITNGPLNVGKGDFAVRCIVPNMPLPAGKYFIKLSMWNDSGKMLDSHDGIPLVITEGDFYKTGKLPEGYTDYLYVQHSWDVQR